MNRDDLKIKIYADGADAKNIFQLANLPYIKGLTTNPSLMRQAGVKDYKKFAKEVLGVVKDIPVSLEVFSDEMDGIYEQAREISQLGENVFVKVPVVNSKGESTCAVVSSLIKDKISLNLTAIMTERQIETLLVNIDKDSKVILSVFAGRIADTGRDPCPMIKSAVEAVKDFDNTEVLWASTREVYNIIQAEEIGCHIITMPYSLIKKLDLFEKDLNEYSRETAEAFFLDAVRSGYKI